MIKIIKKLGLILPEDIRIWLLTPLRGTSYRAEKKRRFQKKEYTDFSYAGRKMIMRSAANYAFINRPIDGYYMEFGVCGATTFRMAYDIFSHLFKWKYLAFDSFEGFPEIQEIDKQFIWKKGNAKMERETFQNIINKHGVKDYKIFPGFYNESLTKELQDQLLPTKAAMIYIDCDLYTSTVPVLKFIAPFMQRGTIIAFDEWNAFWGDPEKGERRAFREFCEQNPTFKFEPFVETQMQKSFMCVSV